MYARLATFAQPGSYFVNGQGGLWYQVVSFGSIPGPMLEEPVQLVQQNASQQKLSEVFDRYSLRLLVLRSAWPGMAMRRRVQPG